MSEFQEFSQTGTTETPRWVGLAVGIFGGLSLVGLGLSWSALNQAKRSEEHTSELQSRLHLVCRLLLEKKKKSTPTHSASDSMHALHATLSALSSGHSDSAPF